MIGTTIAGSGISDLPIPMHYHGPRRPGRIRPGSERSERSFFLAKRGRAKAAPFTCLVVNFTYPYA
jgi:hypothetical protein